MAMAPDGRDAAVRRIAQPPGAVASQAGGCDAADSGSSRAGVAEVRKSGLISVCRAL